MQPKVVQPTGAVAFKSITLLSRREIADYATYGSKGVAVGCSSAFRKHDDPLHKTYRCDANDMRVAPSAVKYPMRPATIVATTFGCA